MTLYSGLTWCKKRQPNLFTGKKKFFLLFMLFTSIVNAQQVTGVITDFNNLWKSDTGSLNIVRPNTSHNVLAFTYNGTTYSTGVDDAKLSANSISFLPVNFNALPVLAISGTVASSTYIATAALYDGIPNGYSNPYPSLKIKDVLIDGVHGLNLGTGATNIPTSASVIFPISSITTAAITDSQPDILISQIADPTSTGDTLYFIDGAGGVVGTKKIISWTSIGKLGTYYLDLYTLPVGSLCDTARIKGTSINNTTRDIRLIAFTLSDFGITTANASGVTSLIWKASGTSDPAFFAYSKDAIHIPAPDITVQPQTQIVCPGTGQSAVFSVTATGINLTYQWRKNGTDIQGETASTYTIANVTAAHAGTYLAVVSNASGSVQSDPAYLNTAFNVQPSPLVQTISTGGSVTLSVAASNTTSFQWQKNNIDVAGANNSSYTINPVNSTTQGDYNVKAVNTANAGCATITSSTVQVREAQVLAIKLTSFKAYNTNTGIQVDWQTAFENNMDHYEIERASDAIQFKSLKSIPASNTNLPTSYKWLDIFPNDSANFYRLKSISQTAEVTYSNIISVISKSIRVNLFPNPALSIINIRLSHAASLKAIITDAGGKTVQVNEFKYSGTGTLQVDISHLKRGIYFLNINSQSIRFIKQ